MYVYWLYEAKFLQRVGLARYIVCHLKKWNDSPEWDRFGSTGVEVVDGGNYIALLSWLRCDGRLVRTFVVGFQP